MDYTKKYTDLITKFKKNEPIVMLDYYETHHIIPICMGGNNSPDNLVKLSAKAHFVAHHLLCKIYPKDYKLASAFNGMCVHDKPARTIRLNARLFHLARKHYAANHPMKNPLVVAKARLGILKYHRGRLSDPNYVPPFRGNCKKCGNLNNNGEAIYCSKECSYSDFRGKVNRTPDQHERMVKNIKKHLNGLTDDQKKDRLLKSLHSPTLDHAARGKAVSEGKRGKKTNQQEIMGRKYANMSDADFNDLVQNKHVTVLPRMINLRNKWIQILQQQ